MTDIEDDGKWNLLDGDAYDASDMTQQALYYWYPGQPSDNKGALCTFIHYNQDTFACLPVGIVKIIFLAANR